MSKQYVEPYACLGKETVNLTQIIESLIEELDAIKNYTQRLDNCFSDPVRKSLDHARKEECEHASKFIFNLFNYDEQFRVEFSKLFTLTPSK